MDWIAILFCETRAAAVGLAGGKSRAVYNFPSDGREFTDGRCLIIADGFYEFTDPEDEPWFCIAGIWRTTKDVGDAFTMLTIEPGPDTAPYHDRRIAILERTDWANWLDPSISAKTILKPLPASSLSVEQIG